MVTPRPAERVSERHPLISHYLEQLEAELSRRRTPSDEIREILLDIENHFSEAQRAGRSLESVLEGLGEIRELAGAYTVALALGVRVGDRRSSWRRWIRSAWLESALDACLWTARASLTLILSVIGVGLVLLGALGAFAAVVLPFVPASFLDPTLRFGLPQLVVFALAVLSLAVGWLALRLVRLKLRSLVPGQQSGGPDPSDQTPPESDEEERAGPSEGPRVLATVARPTIESWKADKEGRAHE